MAESPDEKLKLEIKEAYLEGEPTPDNTVELVASLADQFERSVNSIRMILMGMKNEDGSSVYVKKEPPKASEKKGGTRVNKADALDALTKALESNDLEADEDIIKRMTGKAAIYFTEVIESLKSPS